MSACPRRIVAGPYEYAVHLSPAAWKAMCREHVDGNESALWGYTDHTAGTIHLHPGVMPAMRRTTLLHELLHVASFCSGFLFTGKLAEEEWVLRCAPQFLDMLTRNRGLADYLAGR